MEEALAPWGLSRQKQRLNLKLLSKYFIKMLGILKANKLNPMMIYVTWIFRLSVLEGLRDICFDHKLFPGSFTILRDNRGGSSLGAVMF
jgi:hypothetical protein